jgi:hypothetical protein
MEDKDTKQVENVVATPPVEETKKKRTRKKAEPKPESALVSPIVAPVTPVAPVAAAGTAAAKTPVRTAKQPPPPWEPPADTVAGKIWEHIKNLQMQTFGYTASVASCYVPMNIEPTRLYLTFKSTAFIAFIDDLLAANPPLELNPRTRRMEPSRKVCYKTDVIRKNIVVEIVPRD